MKNELTKRYSSANEFVSDISDRSISILKDLQAFIDENQVDDFEDDIAVLDYFNIMDIKEFLEKIIEDEQ